MTRNYWKFASLVIAVMLLFAVNLQGQQQGGPPPGGGGFKNLKVLPKDIPQQRLMGTMQGFTRALGVTCAHCHGDDKASDEKPEKDVARGMLKMMGNLRQNANDFLPGERIQKVSCWTCHRGSAKIEVPAPPQRPAGQGGQGGQQRPPQN